MSERRLAAIMFTDIVGYSALSQQNESLALELLDTHFQMLRPIFSQHGGKEIKTIGDAFMVEFASPLNAVQCAIKMQGMLHAHNTTQSQDRKIQIRIGIHVGDVETRGNDVFGDGVNIASRIEPLAEAGGICISEQVHDHIHNKLDVKLESIGTPELKNIESSIEVFKVKLSWQADQVQGEPTEPAKLISEKSIAVLPFSNMSADAENEYFSDGITEDIITQLSKIRDLMVISRTSIMQYKGTNKNLRQVGQELGVRSVLEGSVRRAGNKVRITAQLINAETDAHLWADTYDRELTDIFEVQSDVAGHIATALKSHVSPEEKALIEDNPTDNLEAYNLYLQGRHFSNLTDREDWEKALEFYQQAVAMDPNYALAHAGVSSVYTALTGQGYLPFSEGVVQAREAAQQALALNPSLAEAYLAMSYIGVIYDWNWEGTEANFKRALELSPNLAEAHRGYGFFLCLMNRFDEGFTYLKKALLLDPMLLASHNTYRLALIFNKQFEEALAYDLKMKSINPAWEVPSNQWITHFYCQDYEAALNTLDREKRLEWLLIGKAAIHSRLGNLDEARQMLQQLIDEFADPAAFQIALIYFGLGQLDEGFQWLDRAYELRDSGMSQLLVEPYFFNEVRSDPRFIAMLKKMNFPNVEG